MLCATMLSVKVGECISLENAKNIHLTFTNSVYIKL